jgi:sulfur carrier protein ThiS
MLQRPLEREKMIRVRNRQSGEVKEVPGPKTVHELLKAMGLVEGAVLVLRDGLLLTRDVRIADGESVEIVPVISGG